MRNAQCVMRNDDESNLNYALRITNYALPFGGIEWLRYPS